MNSNHDDAQALIRAANREKQRRRRARIREIGEVELMVRTPADRAPLLRALAAAPEGSDLLDVAKESIARIAAVKPKILGQK